MAYKNPKPKLFDDKPDISVQPVKNNKEKGSTYQEHEPVYFAFLDVLGFSKTFEDNREKPSSKFAYKYRDTFQYYASLMSSLERFKEQNLLGTGQTSDSLYFYTDRIDLLLLLIKIFTRFNLYAMSQDVFFRGGISKGKLFIEQPHHFYGDCVIKSYLLEDKIAQLPRVMVDQATYDDLIKSGGAENLIAHEKERHYIKPFIFIPNQDMVEVYPDVENELIDFCKKEWADIGKHIKNGIRQFEFDNNNYAKYCFLKREYDSFDTSSFPDK